MTEPDPSSQTATVDADLAAIDAALSGGATAGSTRERELQELALELRADSPRPHDGFAAELERQVGEGFPRKRRGASLAPLVARVRGARLRPPPMPMLAGAASILLALVVVVALQSGDGQDTQSAGDGDLATPSELRSRDAGEGDAPAEPPAALDGSSRGDGFAPGERNRRIERSASLTLAAGGDRLDRVSDGIATVTDRYGGFVLRSSITTGDEGTTGGSFELRIPATKLQPALRDLSGLGEVRARSQSGQDVTREFVSVEDKLDAARAERRGLLGRLERAETDRQARAIRERLELVSAEIRGLRGQLRDLRLRTGFATVSVSLVERDGNGNGATGGGTGEALDDALGSLVGSLNLALRALGIAIPLALLAVLAWLAARTLRRRRREAVLS